MTMTEEPRANGRLVETENKPSDFEQLLNKPFSPPRPPTDVLAEQLGVPRDVLVDTIKKSIMPRESSNADFLAFCQIAAKYRLNPFTREIFAIPKRGGGVQVVVPIDGWVSIVQRHRVFDGWEFKDMCNDDGEFSGTQCIIYRKDLGHPTVITEWYSECKRETDPWKQYPRRMTRHKALIQGARVAFGIGGIYDEEEGSAAAGYTNMEDAIKNAGNGRRKRSLIEPEEKIETSHLPTNGESIDADLPSPSASDSTQEPAQTPPKPTGKVKDAPTETQPATDAAEEFSQNVPVDELKSWLLTLPQRAKDSALIMAGLKNIADSTDEEVRMIAYNAKFAQLTGGKK